MNTRNSAGCRACLLAISFAIFANAMAYAADEAAPQPDGAAFPMESGRFDDTWESLEQYECPEWFRDAKFGIWAIIGPQCVPMQSDWYARHMYIQGHRQYNHHVKTFGQPSKFGYKDLIEEFDPKKLDFDKLVALSQQPAAGVEAGVVFAGQGPHRSVPAGRDVL